MSPDRSSVAAGQATPGQNAPDISGIGGKRARTSSCQTSPVRKTRRVSGTERTRQHDLCEARRHAGRADEAPRNRATAGQRRRRGRGDRQPDRQDRGSRPSVQSRRRQAQRLRNCLDATPSAQIEVLRADMDRLAAAFERGEISAGSSVKAAQTRLGTLSGVIEEVNTFAEQAGRNIQDALETSGRLREHRRPVEEPADQHGRTGARRQTRQALLGDFAKTGKIGGVIGDVLNVHSGFAVGTGLRASGHAGDGAQGRAHRDG